MQKAVSDSIFSDLGGDDDSKREASEITAL